MKIKISDIAKKAGVSDGTVSNALNNRKGISNEKREFILQIAREMGYFRKNTDQDKLIRLLIINKQAHVVGDTPFFSELVRGIETECSGQGFELVVNHIDTQTLENGRLDYVLKTNQTSGILLLGTEMEVQDLDYFRNVCIPLVILDTAFRDNHFDYVAINNVDGTYEIVEHLIKNGHTNIGIINSSYQINNFRERKTGYAHALNDYNLLLSPENEALVTPTSEGAYLDMKAFLDSFLAEFPKEQLPTAFYAVNDNIAIGAIKAFNELDLSISICGFDDLPICELITPSLTTVHVNKQYLGKTAVSRLVQKINNADYDIQKVLIATKAIPRDSVRKG
ncbi:MAG: LacI family DNA-binding transcriptional regulator [Erysipelotrichales bacterium]